MRIWLLTSELPSGIAAGIARYIDNFARLLGQRGHDVAIVAPAAESVEREFAPGVRLVTFAAHDGAAPRGRYPYDVIGRTPGRSFEIAEVAFALAEKAGAPDVIESQEYDALPYYLLQRKLTERTALERTPVVVHLHGPLFDIARVNQEPRYRFPGYWLGQMEKFGIVAADAVVSPSRFLSTRVTAALGRALPTAHVPLPLCVEPVANGPPPERGRLVCVGRLEWRKGVLQLVRACSRLWSAGAEFTLSLVGQDCVWTSGDTTMRTVLLEEHRQWVDRGRLELTGAMDHAHVLERMRRAWAVVVPSLWDNFPNTCMEAMALRCVVLASRNGGQAEMIDADSESGFLFDWDVEGDLEERLQRVLALSSDDHERVGRAAERRIRTLCDPGAVLVQRVEHYERTIAARGEGRTFPTVTPQRPGVAALDFTSSPGARVGALSVVIPYFNLGKYIDETLESLATASHAPLEILLIDDGSTDEESRARLRALERDGPAGLRVIRTENRGLAATRNLGAEAAQGEFVAFVDADDCVEPEFFARALDVLQRYANVGFVYSWVRYFGAETGIWPTWNAELPYLLGHNMLTPIVVVRRAALLRSGRNRRELAYGLEDFESWVGLVAAGWAGVSLPHPLVRYRVREGSMLRRCSMDQRLYLYDRITEFHEDLYRQWGVELLNLQNANGPAHLWSHPATDLGGEAAAHAGLLRAVAYRLWNRLRRLSVDADRDGLDRRLGGEVERLFADASTVLGLLDNDPGFARASTNGSWSYDYETGARLIGRLRRSWLARQLLRHEGLKQVVKRALQM
jgi:glycosyltransferase involved in cell wall biosynthesis